MFKQFVGSGSFLIDLVTKYLFRKRVHQMLSKYGLLERKVAGYLNSLLNKRGLGFPLE